MSENNPPWMQHNGTDYSCVYREVYFYDRCVVDQCYSRPLRLSMWYLANKECWVPFCEEHEPRPQDIPSAVDELIDIKDDE